MPETIPIALSVPDRDLLQQLERHLAEIAGVKIVARATNGVLPAEPAQVVLVEDRAESRETLDVLLRLRASLPEAALFVVSGRPDPEHIVAVMQSGASEYLLTPLSAAKLGAALDKLRNSLRGVPRPVNGSLYSFISSKGGLGATVLAVNTAAALALRGGDEVAFLDNSLQSGDASVLLDIVPERTIADVCRNVRRLDGAFLRGSMTQHRSGLHYLAAPATLEEGAGIQAEHMGRILSLAKALYGHTVVDCKSMSADQCSVEAFKASDKIFIVTDLSVPAVRNAAHLIRVIHNLRINPLKVQVVVNRFIKGSVPTVGEIEKTLGQRVFWLFPNDFNDVIHSINHGTPLVKEKPRSVLSRNVKEFVDRLVSVSPVEGAYRGAKGLLGRTV